MYPRKRHRVALLAAGAALIVTGTAVGHTLVAAAGEVGTDDRTPTLQTTTTAAGPMAGVFVGGSVGDAAEVLKYESWMAKAVPGYKVDGVTIFTGDANWSDYDGSVGWEIADQMFGTLDRQMFWSMSTIPQGTSWEQAAADSDGTFAQHWKKAATTILSNKHQSTGKVIIRTGWEWNGNWFWYKAKGHEAAFAKAYRNFVTAFRSVPGGDRFMFDWNVSLGYDDGTDLAAGYPGDSYVDIVSADIYWSPGEWGQPTDGNQAWTWFMNHKVGLRWQADFAAAHGKAIGFPEWGVKGTGPNTDAYLRSMRDWMLSHHTVYQSYWDSDYNYTGKMSSGQYPSTAQAYRSIIATMGGGSPTTPTETASPSGGAGPSGGAKPSGGTRLVGVGSGRCLTPPSQRGRSATISDCANQTMSVTPAGEIVFNGRCLDASGARTSDGTAVTVWRCHGGANQKWKINADGTITGVQSGRCLDVKSELTAAGTKVQLWSCHGRSNQRWTLQG